MYLWVLSGTCPFLSFHFEMFCVLYCLSVQLGPCMHVVSTKCPRPVDKSRLGYLVVPLGTFWYFWIPLSILWYLSILEFSLLDVLCVLYCLSFQLGACMHVVSTKLDFRFGYFWGYKAIESRLGYLFVLPTWSLHACGVYEVRF